MSAYICDDIHLSALAIYAKEHDLGTGVFSALDIFEVLHCENERSVNHRYRDAQPFEANFELAKGVQAARHATPAQIYMSARCYAYQACEHPEWEQSAAFRIIELIKTHAVAANGGGFSAAEESSANWGAPGPSEY